VDHHRHPASVGQAKQPLIPACIDVAPPFTLAGEPGEPGQEFIGECAGIVFVRVLPIKIVVRTRWCNVRSGWLIALPRCIRYCKERRRDCDKIACPDRSSTARRDRLTT
jgi:hypothetical protein